LSQKPATPAEVKVLKRREAHIPQPPRSPASSIAVESDLGSGSLSPTPLSPALRPQSTDSVPAIPPGITPPPPGLSAPPGLPTPSRQPHFDATPPQIVPVSQSSYQMSMAAQALLDDVKARREAPLPSTYVSPFPDFDRTLQTLSGGDSGGFGGFSFNLDPKLAGDDTDASAVLPDFDVESNIPFRGTFTDVFPALRPPSQLSSPSIPFGGPPGISYSHNASRAIFDPLTTRPIERQSTGGSNYTGSFNPFAEANDDSMGGSPSRKSQYSPLDEDRKVSRFGFARGRQGSTAASSPLHVSSPLNNNNDSHTSFYNSNDLSAQSSQWPVPNRQQQQSDYGYSQSNSQLSSPLAQHAQAQASFSQQPSRFQSFDSGVSEAQLRELIQSSRERARPTTSDGPAGMRLLFV
jgi:CCR4-NOT transcription complex subunit 4